MSDLGEAGRVKELQARAEAAESFADECKAEVGRVGQKYTMALADASAWQARADAAEQRVAELVSSRKNVLDALGEVSGRMHAAEAREQALRDRVGELDAELNTVMRALPHDWRKQYERAEKADRTVARVRALHEPDERGACSECSTSPCQTFTLLSPPTADTDPTPAKPKHDHESWQLQESAKGGWYCAACGEHVDEGPTGR